MPLLDVSDILSDPDLASVFTVTRRAEVVGTDGRSTTQDKTYSRILGVVTQASPNDLNRLQDYQFASRAISVVTTWQLRGESQGFQPDIVNWAGSQYLVITVEPYAQFGRGFCQAICVSVTRTDPPI